jgi:alpha-glucosidase
MTNQARADAVYFLRTQEAGKVTRLPNGIEVTLDQGEDRFRAEVLHGDILRLKISRGGNFDEQPTVAVMDADLAVPVGAEFSIDDTPGAVRLTTPELTLTVGKSPFRLDVHRADGSPVFESAGIAYATLNDEFLLTRRCLREDAFYGLGEKAGRFNRAGGAYTLWNTDVLAPGSAAETWVKCDLDDPRADPRGTVFDPYYVSIPFFYHQRHLQSAMAGFFFDNPYRARFDFDQDETFTIHFCGGQYTEYVFAGPRMPDILAAYTKLTGRMQAPPLWALGYHQCRWFAYTQETILDLAARHRQQDFPCDCLWLDIDYMCGYRVFTWNREAFPDPPAMLAALRAHGFRVITIIDPGVKYEHGYPVFDEAWQQDLLCRTEAGAVYAGQVWPPQGATGAEWPGGHLERHERTRHG